MNPARVSAPHRVGDLLTAAVPALAERMLVGDLQRQWADIVGAALARRSWPAALERGALEIRADNSPWLSELQLRSGEILDALRRRHGRSVLSLRFALGARPTARPATAPSGSDAPARLSPDDARAIEEAVAGFDDPALASALRRLLTKDRLARRQRPSPSPAEKDPS
jgi:hypothetical protein